LRTEQLREAHWLSLSAIAASPGALALVTDMADAVAAHERLATTRKKGRGRSGAARQQQAVGAILGGLLRRWGRSEPEAVFRSRKRDDFSGGPVAARQYLAACDALFALRLIHQSRSIRYGSGIIWEDGGPEHFAGKAPRLWPTQALLEAAVRRGVTPATLPHDFKDAYPTRPPPVPEPIQMFTLKQPRRTEKAAIPIKQGDPEAARLLDRVSSYNAWIAEHDLGRTCLPPRLKRVFAASWRLGGRWYAVGGEGNYQRMSEAERLGLTINDEPIVEVDVHASHLSIMHGLLGLPLPDGDLYEFPDVPRAVVKAWITATLGKGSPVRRWAPRAVGDDPDLLNYDPKLIGQAICGRYRSFATLLVTSRAQRGWRSLPTSRHLHGSSRTASWPSRRKP
jgi:hypothetical protein